MSEKVSIFNDNVLNTRFTGSHIISNNSKTLNNLGLGSFDLYNLDAWVNGCKDRDRINPEQRFLEKTPVTDENGDPVLDDRGEQTYTYSQSFKSLINTIIGSNHIDEDPHNGYLNIEVWRTSGRNGEYIQIEKFTDWKFEDAYGDVDGNAGDSFDYQNINFDEMNGETFVENLVLLNNYVQDLLITDPRKETWTTSDKIRYEFIIDIMSSKNGYIEWQTNNSFRRYLSSIKNGRVVSELGGAYTEQNNTFKMNLFNLYDSMQTGRDVALKKFDVVGRRSYYDIGPITALRDGEVDPAGDQNDPKEDVAGELDMQYTGLLGKWESGTPQMIAVLTTSLPAAKGVEIDYLEEESVKSILDKEFGQEIVFGSAIPLHMQNENPRQWSPTYEKFKNDRKKDQNEKNHIRIANLSPNTYSRGDMVILNRIEGLWFPIPLNNPSGVVEEPIPTIYPQWEFMYLATNERHHFRNKAGVRITPDEYEKGFYNKYYDKKDRDVEPDDNVDRYDESFDSKADVYNEYYQFTSWDFMGDQIGGLRTTKPVNQGELMKTFRGGGIHDLLDFNGEVALCSNHGAKDGTPWKRSVNGNALANINYYEDSNGESYDDEILNTYPYFGCVFPDGYSTATFFDKIIEDENTIGVSNTGRIFSVVPPSYKDYNYITCLPTRGNVLKNYNDLDVEPNGDGDDNLEAGMFSDSGNLSNLPADIATISSPSGKWGYPISSVAIFDINDHVSPNPIKYWRDFLHEYIFSSGAKFGYQNRYGWVFDKHVDYTNYPQQGGQMPDEPPSETFDPLDSSWGLKPQKSTRIQFRPLCKELYTFLERADAFALLESCGPADESQPALYGSNFEFNNGRAWAKEFFKDGILKRGDDSERLWGFIGGAGYGYESPVSKYAVTRELSKLKNPEDAWFRYPLSDSDGSRNELHSLVGAYGLKYADDLGSGILPYLLDGTDQGYPYNWWQYYWLGGGGGLQAPGGYGIIGATCTVYADTTLAFSTENVHLEDFVPEGGQLTGETLHSVKTGDYDDDATTTLFARVYQHWPRHLTMYDPRFFVVHHFNPGVENPYISYDNVENNQSLIWDIYTKESGLLIKDIGFPLNQGKVDDKLKELGLLPPDPAAGEQGVVHTLPQGYVNPSGWFGKSRRVYEVDNLIPTTWFGRPCELGTQVYADATYNTELRSADQDIRLTQHWNVDNLRRGKLLPFTYRVRTIGIGAEGTGYVCKFIEPPKEDATDPVKIQIDQHDVVIFASGDGYKVNDEFTIDGGTGGGVIYKVTEITGTETTGGIKRIEPRDELDRGIGYSPGDFEEKLVWQEADPENSIEAGWISNYLLWEPNSSPPVSNLNFVPLEAEGAKTPTGQGFKAYALRGTVLLGPPLTDNKPSEPLDSQGPIELTPLTYPLSQNAVNRFNIVDPDDNKTYDIFLRYHNDIAHVGHGVTQSSRSTPQPREQMVTLTIDTQIGAAGAGDSISVASAGGGAVAAAGGLGSANLGFSMGGSTTIGNFGGSLALF